MRSKEQKEFIRLCETHGGRLHKLGKGKYEFVCLCPTLHREKTPSFTFNKSSLKFHCFGCGCSGQGLDDLMKRIPDK
jgi:DNA primase